MRRARGVHDEAALHLYAKLCAEAYSGSQNPLLNRKYHQLMREAEAAPMGQRQKWDHASIILLMSAG